MKEYKLLYFVFYSSTIYSNMYEYRYSTKEIWTHIGHYVYPYVEAIKDQ